MRIWPKYPGTAGMVRWLLGVCVIVTTPLTANGVTIDGIVLSKKLHKFSENITGIPKMQQILDNGLFRQSKVDGEVAIDTLTKSLKDKFTLTFRSLRKIRDKLEDEYATYTEGTSYTRCCQYPTSTVEYEARLKTKVDYRNLCYRKSMDAQCDSIIPASNDLLTVFKKNRDDNPAMKWQYFGSEEGTFVTYPARSSPSKCATYDPRYRPWYVEAATVIPKDIVVVIDRSDSMYGTKMSIAREAAKTVVGTLNPNDRLGLVMFSTEAHTPPGTVKIRCYGKELSFATGDNQDYLKGYIDSVTPWGSTNYTAALIKAFGLLARSCCHGSARRAKAILFLTDGQPNGNPAPILERLSKLNAQLNNEVVILTFGVGEDLNKNARELLRNMSLQTKADLTKGDVKIGEFKWVQNVTNLRYQLASYYNIFSDATRIKHPSMTVPYIDYSGLGVIISVCLPVFSQPRKLRGVASIDMSMADLISDVTYFKHGQNSYAFIVDSNGRTLTHPLLQNPFGSYKTIPVFTDIGLLEPAEGAKYVIASMKRGGSENKVVLTELVQSRGDPRRDGVLTTKVNATYYWRRIGDTKLSVCIVVPTDSHELTIDSDQVSAHFVYHRFDLLPHVDQCRYLGRLNTIVHSVVKFTGAAFKNAYKYFDVAENIDTIQRYVNVMMDKAAEQFYFKEGVREMVALTEHIDEFWKSHSTSSVLRRYVGFYAGFFRVFPGALMSKQYDPVERPWYQKAVTHPNKLILTLPYKDALGGGVVVSMAKTLREGRLSESHSRADSVLGVIAVDVTLGYLYQLLTTIYPVCNTDSYTCFIVDTSGYIVFHDDFIRNAGEDVHYIHIANKEPDIAKRLIHKGHLIRVGCRDYTTKHVFHTWRLQIDDAFRFDGERSSYYMESVGETNVFIGFKSTGSVNRQCYSCANRSLVASTSPLHCQFTEDDICQCPCHEALDFHYCRNTFPHREDGLPVCSPVGHEPNFSSPLPNDTAEAATLPRCYRSPCHNITEKGACLAAVGCVWYHVSTHKAKCIDKEEVSAMPPPKIKDDESEAESNIVVIVCSVVGAVIVVGIIVAGVVRHYRRPAVLVYQGRGTSPTSSTTSGIFAPGTVNPVYAHDPLSCTDVGFRANDFNTDTPTTACTDRPSYISAIRGSNESCNSDPT